MSDVYSWIPEMARKDPTKWITVSYQVHSKDPPDVETANTVNENLSSASLTAVRTGVFSWEAVLPWQTRVFGIIPRDVDEVVVLDLLQRPNFWELGIRCLPIETHAAHATGVAAVLFVAVSVWVATGFVAGLAAAFATVVAGALIVEFTRQWAFDALEKRLRSLAGDIGGAMWPGQPAQIIGSN